MKRAVGLLLLPFGLWASYTYYYSDALTSINSSNWTQNGSVAGTSGGLTATSTNGGSLISKVTVPGSYPSNYEVKVTLALTASGGTYVTYIRATPNAQSGPALAGTAYAVELQNPAFSGGVCTGATLAAYQIVNGISTNLGSSVVPCRNGMVLRTVLTAGNGLVTYIDNFQYLYLAVSAIGSGQPGIGARGTPAGNSISLVGLGQLDTVPPQTINAQSIETSAFPNHVDFQWGGVVDDPNGSGLDDYALYRNGVYVGSSHDAAFTDATVAANTTYTYTITAIDFHYNVSSQVHTVVTPPAQAVDPREIGIRPLGSYWGGAGEDIDMRSGNLSYSTPLLRAQGRGGWGVSFLLSYNSQNWRQDAGGVWSLGRDNGYGYGFTLQAGSLLPVWNSYWAIDHYVFTDGTGAAYRLDQNSGNVWTSKEAIYVSYDANAGRLYFPDGSFWILGSVSSGDEWDAGTQYPTVMEDTNGNQILISYQAGGSVSWTNSSGRIVTIQDARAGNASASYSFTYNTASPPELTGITSNIGTGENYTFSKAAMETYSPFSDHTDFGAPGYLNSFEQNGTGLTTSFTYDTSGELTEVVMPYGGQLQWAYASCTLNGRTLREVQYRYLTLSSGGTAHTYQVTRDPGDASRNVHLYGGLIDNDANAAKVWWLQTDTTQINAGLVTEFDERNYPAQANLRIQNYAYAQDTAGNPYVSSVTTTADPGLATQIQKMTTQTLDGYGNVTAMQLYDWGNLTAPARTYTNTYLYQNNANYSSRYIFNRLLASTLTSVTPNVILAQNTYDTGTVSSPTGTPSEWDSTNYGTSFIYRGNITQANAPGKTINTHYDATGTVVSQDDNNNHSVNVSTSSATNFTLPEKLDPNGTGAVTTKFAYNPSSFAPASVAGPNQSLYDPNTYPNGTSAYTAYDSYGRISYTLAPSQVAGQAAGAQTNYTYATAAPWTTTATTAGHWTSKTPDGFGRTARVQSGYGTTTVSTVDTVYAPCGCSPLGKVSQQSQPYGPNDSEVYTTYTYDALGRTTKVLLPDGASNTQYAYQGNVTTLTDPAGNWKQYFSDALGNLVTVLEPDPTANPVVAPPNPPPAYPVTTAPSGTLITSYTYDQFNHLTQVSMPRSTGNGPYTQIRTFTYASTAYPGKVVLPALWLTSATNPENGTVSYTYNGDGTLATKHDANGNTLTYTYDSYGRVLTSPAGTFTYDSCATLANPAFCTNTAGQLVEATFGTGVGPNQLSFQYDYTYTPAGKVSSKMLTLQSANNRSMWNVEANGSLTASYSYDSQGALTSMIYPTGETWAVSPVQTFTYTLDAMERPTGLSDSVYNKPWASGATYNAANQPLNDGTAARTYNSLLQATSMTGSGMNMTYNYSATRNNGQIVSSVDAITGETITYQYDALKRLLSASGKNWGETYTYDGFGNLNQMQPTGTTGAPSLSVTVDPTTNRLTATGAAYDNNGNLYAGFGGMQIWHDTVNRASQVQIGGQSSYYGYDPDNLRVYYRNASGAETIYFYGVDGRKLATYTYQIVTYNGNPEIRLTQQSENVYFLGKLVAAEGLGGGQVSTDRLGSVRSGGSGYQAQYPYGVEYTTTANDREKYATYTRDSLTGLDYAVNRYYSSQWGRFLSPDPYPNSAGLGDPGSWNRYAYVEDDPVNRNDPSGLCDALIGGINMTPESGSQFGEIANELGAITAYPYSATAGPLGVLAGGLGVLAQGLGSNPSTDVGVAAITAMAAQGGGILWAYSGGAEVIKKALPTLPAAVQQAIHGIVYIAPGAVGGLPLSPSGPTIVVTGKGVGNILAGLPTSMSGIVQLPTGCAHTDLDCFESSVGIVLNHILKPPYDSIPCDSRPVFTQQPIVLQPYSPFGPGSYWYWFGYMMPPVQPSPAQPLLPSITLSYGQ